MSKLIELMDMYLAIRDSGRPPSDMIIINDIMSGNLKDMFKEDNEPEEATKVDAPIKLLTKPVEKQYSKIISEKDAEIADLKTRLSRRDREYYRLLEEIQTLKKKTEIASKDIDRIKNGWGDFKTEAAATKKKINEIEKVIECIDNSDDIEVQIRRINELSIKEKSFKYNKTLHL